MSGVAGYGVAHNIRIPRRRFALLHAAAFAELGIPAFGCTPDLFPELMATAIMRQDVGQWLARVKAG